MNQKDYNAWQTSGLPYLNIANFCIETKAHGPGLRSAVWVQGCPFRCNGCISPEWIPNVPKKMIKPQKMADVLLENSSITGVTFSGGEPMMQAGGLNRLIQIIRNHKKNITLVCFTGFTLNKLKKDPPSKYVKDFLSAIDVLIDGQYIKEFNDNKGFRGSNNQKIHYLSNRILPEEYDFENSERTAEIRIRNGEALLVGVPPNNLIDTFDKLIEKVNRNFK